MNKVIFYLSIALNFIIIIFLAFTIYSRGGITYLKQRFSSEKYLTKDTVKNSYYLSKKTMFELLPNENNEIIFLGNSLTDRGNWAELFNNSKIKNRGIEGDVIGGVINRIDEITTSRPNKIFLMIGVNDIAKNKDSDIIISEYKELISLIRKKSPRTNIYIQSILPTNTIRYIQNNEVIPLLNNELETFSENNNKLTYINLYDGFKDVNGKLSSKYSYDGLHLNGEGYLLWKDMIQSYINE